MPNRTRMSHVDAAWLHSEKPTNLVVIYGMLLFDEPLVYEQVVDVLQTRLVDAFPRFRWRVVHDEKGGKVWWEDVPDFDVHNHIEQLTLNESIESYVSRMMSVPLDFGRPPWKLHMFELPDGKHGIFVRVHHAMGDGIALVRMLFSMTDGGEYIQVLKQPSAGKSTWNMAKVALRGVGSLFSLIFRLPDNRSVYKGKPDIEKRAAWSRPISLDQIKSLRTLTDGTVNDVLLTAISGGLRRYALTHGHAAKSLRATIPVNLRPLDGEIELGNKFGLVFLTLPLEINDPLERMVEIKRRMDVLKRSPEPVITYGLLNLLGRLPIPLLHIGFRIFSSKATGVMTNVPGPTNQVTFADTPMKSFMFWVPQPAGLGLGISILSYNGEVRVGVATDAELVPDPQAIIVAFEDEFDKLVALNSS